MVPIKTAGIIKNENTGKIIRLPNNPYVGIAPKWAATNGAVNSVATPDVKTVAQITFANLFSGIRGLTTEYIHTNPNTAAKDN